MDGFRNEDEAIGHWLARLRDGGAEEQATARTELGLIMERRGLVDDAIEAYRTNVAAGTRDPRPYQRLAAIYRERGDVAAEASVLDALAAVHGESESPTMTDLPTLTPAPTPTDAAPVAPPPDGTAPRDLPPVDRPEVPPSEPLTSAARPSEAVPIRVAPEPEPVGAHPPAPADPPGSAAATGVPPGRRPPGQPVVDQAPRRRSISPAAGILIALLGLLVLIGAVVFAMNWSGEQDPVASLDRAGGGVAASAAGAAGAPLAAAPAQTPTPAPPPASCWDPAVRFPESQQPAESVRTALLAHLERQDADLDPSSPQVASLLNAHVDQADELVAGWMGVQLQRAQRGLSPFSLASYVGSELLVPNEAGRYTLHPTISEQGWREMQAWPADSCEGAFMKRPENAPWVTLMRASVGDISWALAAPSPAPSPSPAPR